MLTTITRRLYGAATFLLLVVVTGTLAYRGLGHGRWTWTDCLYHTVITLSTVGYNELPNISDVPLARPFTVVLIIMGMGAMLYFASNVTALFVESDLRGVLRRNRMRKAIERLRDHVIVCGVGRTGQHVVGELRATRTAFVVIDTDVEKLARMHADQADLVYLAGDATEDETLLAAGILRARGVVSALDDNRDNLYVTLSARALNPALRIVTKGINPAAEPKLRKAGADRVVSPNIIGGLRLASEMIRPNVAAFLDIMMHDPEHVLRIEVPIAEGCRLAGQTLADAGLRKVADVLVVAVRSKDGRYQFNPGAEQLLDPGSTLLVLGEMGEIGKLRAFLVQDLARTGTDPA